MHQSLKSLELQEDVAYTAWLKGLSYPVQLIKKIFKNEDGSSGILYIVSNDMHSDANHLYDVYKKRWRIEEFHKSVKQNASLAKSPTKKAKTQMNHFVLSIVAYVKLEWLKQRTGKNHFAMKTQIYLAAQQAAYKELKNLSTPKAA